LHIYSNIHSKTTTINIDIHSKTTTKIRVHCFECTCTCIMS